MKSSEPHDPFFTQKEWDSLVVFRPREWRKWWQEEPRITKVMVGFLTLLAAFGGYTILSGDGVTGWVLIGAGASIIAVVILSMTILIVLASMRWACRKTGVASFWRRVRPTLTRALWVCLWAGIAAAVLSDAWPYLSTHPTKMWYAVTKQIPADHVEIGKVPHDCDFLKAPIGEKFCHYEPTVTVEGPNVPGGAKYLIVTYQRIKE